MRNVLIRLLAVAAFFGVAQAQDEGLVVWTHFGGAELEWLQNQAASFEAAFGVPVTLTRIELGEIKQRMLLAAPQGEAGCLITPIPHDQVGEMAAGGVLADMSQYATPAYLADLTEQARLAFTINGRLFGLPMAVEGPALIINTDLVPNPPQTYEEMIAMAQDLTDGDTFGFLFEPANFYFAYNWLRSFGGYVFERDADGNLVASDVGLASEGAVRGAEEIRRLQYDYGLIPAGTDGAVMSGLFNEGSLGMMYSGPWAIPDARAGGVNLAVVPVPPTEDGTEFAGFMGVQGVLMNEFCPDKVTAANFAKWITRPDAQASLARTGTRIPASIAAAAQVSDDPVIAGFAAALANAEPMPNIPEMGNVWGPMGDALTLILETGDSNASQILQDAVRQIQGN